METGVIVGVTAIILMALIAVLVAVISAVATVSGHDKPEDLD